MSSQISDFYYLHSKKLGEGGFAKVKLATHLAINQYVAIKCIDKEKVKDELPRIYNEIECLKKLKHNNIARLLQVFETESTIFLVLEHCPGGELFDYIVSKQRLDEDEAAQILHDLMRVLEFIHIHGFAHRDLKPENLLFDEKHRIKLIDFGLAANCSTNASVSLEHLKTCCGSLTYAAPELISGITYNGTMVDVWSAGVILYALLIGQLPFNESKVAKLYELIKGGIKELPDYLSSDARDLIKRMLTVDPGKRITVREILFHPWIKSRTAMIEKNRRNNEINQAVENRVLYRCLETFPDMSLNQLRNYIKQDFNYYSAAYQLLRAKHLQIRAPSAKRRLMSDFDSSYEEAIASAAKRPVLIPINEHNQEPPSVKIPMKPALMVTPEKSHPIATPARRPMATPARRAIATPVRRPLTTPGPQRIVPVAPYIINNRNIIESTPRKSVFKRLIESATPSRKKDTRRV